MKLARKRKDESLTNIIDEFYNTYHKSSDKKESPTLLSPVMPEPSSDVSEISSYETPRQVNGTNTQYQSIPQPVTADNVVLQQKVLSNGTKVSPMRQSVITPPLQDVSETSQHMNVFSNLPQDIEDYQNIEDESQFLGTKADKLFGGSTNVVDNLSKEKQSNLFEQISSALEETDTEMDNKGLNSLDFFTEPSSIIEDEVEPVSALESDKSLDSHVLTSDIDTLAKRIEFLVKEVDQLKSENKNVQSTETQEPKSILSSSNEDKVIIPRTTSHITESYELLQKSTSKNPPESQSSENKNVLVPDLKNIEKVEIDESPLANLKAKITTIMDNVNATSSHTSKILDASKSTIGNKRSTSNVDKRNKLSQDKITQSNNVSTTPVQNTSSTVSLKTMKLDIQADKNIFNKDKLDSVLGLLNEDTLENDHIDDTERNLPNIKANISSQYTNLPKHIKITRKYRMDLGAGALSLHLELTNKDTNLLTGNYTIEYIVPEGWKQYVSSVVFETALSPSASQEKIISIPFSGLITSWYLYSGKY